MSRPHHAVEDLIRLFNREFLEDFNTELVRGDGEPEYRPADAHHPHHRILFAHGFFASALHEIAHWCIAGEARRQQIDYGYWYKPDGRSDHEQQEFERVEARPQAYEWLLSQAAGHPFHFSADNLDGNAEPSDAFKASVNDWIERTLAQRVPDRLARLCRALSEFYRTEVSWVRCDNRECHHAA